MKDFFYRESIRSDIKKRVINHLFVYISQVAIVFSFQVKNTKEKTLPYTFRFDESIHNLLENILILKITIYV